MAGSGSMPTSHDSSHSELSELGRLLWRALAELPIRTQLRLFHEMDLGEINPNPISNPRALGRPFTYASVYLPDLPSSTLDAWLETNRKVLTFGLLRHHGLDVDRIALLYQFQVLTPPTIRPVGVKASFAADEAEKFAAVPEILDLRQLSRVTNILVEFDAAYRTVFDPFGLQTQPPQIRLTPGTISTWLTGSAAGIGLTLLLDVASHGASLPFTLPLYLKLAAGGTMASGGIARFVVEQRKDWASGTRTFAEAKAISLKADAEAEKIRADAEKTRAEAEKIRTEQVKTRTETLKTGAEAYKILMETLIASAKSPEETEKARAEIQKLIAETNKTRAETEALSRGQSEEVVSTPPPSSMVSKDLIEESAIKYKVDPAIAALAVNVRDPILARAQDDGMQLSLLDDGSG
jgi:hypothetical protein